jgi:hypothetical protein
MSHLQLQLQQERNKRIQACAYPMMESKKCRILLFDLLSLMNHKTNNAIAFIGPISKE